MNNKAKMTTGNILRGSYHDTWGRNGQPVKMYVPTKEEDESDE